MSAFTGCFLFGNNILHNRQSDLLLKNPFAVNENYNFYNFENQQLIVHKIDVKAFDEESWLSDSDGCLSTIAGDPLIIDNIEKKAKSRSYSTMIILNALKKRDNEPLINSRGNYCGVVYDALNSRLFLFTDRLGIRPLYYCVLQDRVTFSTSLRILERLEWLKKDFDLVGAAEKATFGYCLGDRTGYKNIKLLESGSILEVMDNGISIRQYWSLRENIQLNSVNKDQKLNDLYKKFNESVSIRRRGDCGANVMLSGGMDSRCIATALASFGCTINSFTFYRNKNSVDLAIACDLASRLSTFHTEAETIDCDYGGGSWPIMFSHEVERLHDSNEGYKVERPRLAWTGDGGSVGVGRVYLNHAIQEALAGGDIDKAVSSYLVANNISGDNWRFLHFSEAKKLTSLATTSVREYIKNAPPVAQGLELYFFLIENDQRRHLAGFFDAIDLYGVDLITPFFDPDFLTMSASFDPDYALYHRMYADWIYYFPKVYREVAWQNYPAHALSPVSLPSDTVIQWSKNYTSGSNFRPYQRALAYKIIATLMKGHKHKIISKHYLLVLLLVAITGTRDITYLLERVRCILEIYQNTTIDHGSFSH